ncbi:MAG: HAD family hydrolase [Campylobacterales bacterium]
MTPVVLFDLDGTLIDSTEAIVESFGVAFEQFGVSPPDQLEIKQQIGHTLHDMFRVLGVKEELVEAHVQAYKAHYRMIASEKTTLLPRAREALELAANFARLGVVTTKTGRYSKEILEHLGVMAYFETLVGFEDVTFPKPHPEPILTALERMGCEVSPQAWMIGDTPLDIMSANSAGISHIAVVSGYASHEELAKHTTVIVPDAYEAVIKLYKKESY